MLIALLLQAATTVAGPAPGLLQEPVTPAGRAALRAVLQWPQECEDEHQAAVRLLEIEDEGRVRFLDLGQKRALVEVACARAAYQDSYRYFLLDESPTPPAGAALSLPSRELDEDDQWQPAELPEIAGDPSFDKKRRTLTVFARARGLGDCGLRGTWRVDLKEKRLVLVELLGRECDGEPEQAPPVERWPRLVPPPTPPRR